MSSILNEGLMDENGNQPQDFDPERGHGDGRQESSHSQERGADPYMVAFRIFSAITALAALLCTAVNIISVVQSFKRGRNIFEGVLRCYAVVIALFVAVAETEWERILHFWRMLEFWVGRGMLQIFVAVMTEALSNERRDRAYQVVLAHVASGMLLGCGAIYVIAGLLCVGRLKRSRMEKANWREKAAKEYEDLEKRRGELQKLLTK